MFSALKLFLFICWLLGNLFIFIWEVSIVDIFCCVFVYTFFLFLFFVLCVFFVFVLLFYSLFGGWGLWGELISFFLRIICFCLKSWFLISVSLNTKCALWVILMQFKMTFVRPITSVTPDLVFTVTSWWHVSMPRRWEPNNEVLTVSNLLLSFLRLIKPTRVK